MVADTHRVLRAGTLIAFSLGIAVGVLFSNFGSSAPNEVLDEPSAETDVLAVVDGTLITVADFESEVDRRGGAANFPTAVARRALLDEMVSLEVLVAQARRRGLDSERDVRADVKHVLAGRYRQQELEPRLQEVAVSDDEIDDAYHDHEQSYLIPAAYRAAMIHFAWSPTSSEEFRRQLRERAATAREEAAAQPADEHFGALAVRYSDDQATRYVGGEIGWLVEGQEHGILETAVLDAIFAAQPGGSSELVETPSGLYLVRVMETRAEQLRPLQEVADEIRARLLAEKTRALTSEFRREAARGLSIHIDEARLAAIQLPGAEIVDTDRRPPAVPQG